VLGESVKSRFIAAGAVEASPESGNGGTVEFEVCADRRRQLAHPVAGFAGHPWLSSPMREDNEGERGEFRLGAASLPRRPMLPCIEGGYWRVERLLAARMNRHALKERGQLSL
jgi:hypothetical protein